MGLTLLLALGCATAASPEPTASATLPQQESPGGVQDAPGVGEPPPTGTSVGDRVPDFAITLSDGSTVTSADLIAQGQPTFLYFFATW